jgi:hypothetical protein
MPNKRRKEIWKQGVGGDTSEWMNGCKKAWKNHLCTRKCIWISIESRRSSTIGGKDGIRRSKNEVNIYTQTRTQFKCTQYPECIMFHKCANECECMKVDRNIAFSFACSLLSHIGCLSKSHIYWKIQYLHKNEIMEKCFFFPLSLARFWFSGYFVLDFFSLFDILKWHDSGSEDDLSDYHCVIYYRIILLFLDCRILILNTKW